MKTISRTIKSWEITIKDGETREILSQELLHTRPKKEKIAVKYIKETEKTNFFIEIDEHEEKREMSLEDFIKYSKVVEDETQNKNESDGE